jgi:glutathione S-transferase kappa 1
MIMVKEHYSREMYEGTFITLWRYIFEQHTDISKPENMSKALREHFTDDQARDILEAASTSQYKQGLRRNTERAIQLGAFGAPFFWVRNDKGQEEPFFGSDRFHFMWDFIGIPWSDIAIQERARL